MSDTSPAFPFRIAAGHLLRFVGLFLPVTAAVLLFGGRAVAEGLRNPPPGGFGLSRAGGKIAHVDDASAIHHNPANIVGIQDLTASVAPNFVYISADFQSSITGGTASTKDPWKILPNLFAVIPLKEDRYTLGLGVVTPYGLSNEWERQGAYGPGGILRYASPYYTELKTINVQPTFAARINENFSAGIGVDIMWSDLDFRQIFPTFLLGGVGDGDMRARAQGTGYGFNLGLTYKIGDRHTLAATYRSPISINYDGKFTMGNPPPGTPTRSTFGSHIKYPTIVGLGYGLQVTEDVRIGADFEWLQWSNFNQLPVGVGAPPPGLPTGLNQNWSNGFTAGIAGDWQINENWAVRGGYQFYDSPIPDHNFSNSIPGSDQNVLTVGLGWKSGRQRVELAFSEVFYKRRNITSNQNPALLGTHKTTVHLFALTYQIGF